MTTLTDKELIKEIKERIGSLDVRDNIERRAYEIALASLAAEPVAKIIAHYPLGVDVGKQKFVQAIRELPDFGGYLFAAPPAPIVPEEMYWQDAPVEGSSKAAAYATGWNDCREAMLQSGNFRENKNSSTNNFREIAETSTNYPVIPSEVLSAILKVAKIRADFDDFDGDRRGIGDCLDEAEQELIVTINKYASQLAAEPIATNDVREQTAVPPVPVIQADVAQAIEKLKRKLVECNRYNYCADAVKGVEYACHAAMLQGSQPVSQSKTYRLDFGQWLEQQRGKIDVDCGCVSTETFMHWLRVAYEAGNHPDFPDSSQQSPKKSVKTTLERGYLEAALKIKPGHTLGVIDAMLVHEMAKALLPLVADKIPNKADI